MERFKNIKSFEDPDSRGNYWHYATRLSDNKDYYFSKRTRYDLEFADLTWETESTTKTGKPKLGKVEIHTVTEESPVNSVVSEGVTSAPSFTSSNIDIFLRVADIVTKVHLANAEPYGLDETVDEVFNKSIEITKKVLGLPKEAFE